MKDYILHRINPFSLFKAGCLVGFLASCLPVFVVTSILASTVKAIAEWLGGMVYSLRLPLLGDIGINIDVIELLHLQEFNARMQSWSALGFFEIILLSILVMLIIAAFWGVIAALFGLIFNLISRSIGGIKVSMTEDVEPKAPAGQGDEHPASQ